MQAIQTRYIAPTQHRGARIVAKAQAGTHTIQWDHALDVQANHERAAMLLAYKLWPGSGPWVGGALPDSSYAWVLSSIPSFIMSGEKALRVERR